MGCPGFCTKTARDHENVQDIAHMQPTNIEILFRIALLDFWKEVSAPM